jgi:hypothetical protein
MDEMTKFSSNFWGTDFCGSQGFDALIKRLKEGKKTCTDYEEYLEKWAKLEDTYGKELLKLARHPYGREEIGTLRKSWEQLKQGLCYFSFYSVTNCTLFVRTCISSLYMRMCTCCRNGNHC